MIPRFWRHIPHYYDKKKSLASGGVIVTYTVLRTSMYDPAKENVDILVASVPTVIAIIELSDGSMLTSQVVDCRPEEIEIGTVVEPVFRRVMEHGRKGLIEYGYKWRPKRLGGEEP